MSRLREAVVDYLTVRRTMGYKLERHERLLAQFVDYLDEVGATTVTTEHALTWSTQPKADTKTWWGDRLTVVRGFANYLTNIDPATEVPPTDLLASQRRRATPYLYSDQDIAALLTAAASLRSPWRATTHQTLLGLLSVTGLRIGEAIRLDRHDLDADRDLLVVRSAKFGNYAEPVIMPSEVWMAGSVLEFGLLGAA
jgi:integrase/recombinase XerD